MSDSTIIVTPPDLVTVTVTPPDVLNLTVSQAGVAGLSAYQVAVVNGFVGTEAEWLASLASGGITAGSGFQIVGSELRYDITSLTRG